MSTTRLDIAPPIHAACAPALARTAQQLAVLALLACGTATQAQTGPDLRRTRLLCDVPLGQIGRAHV